MYQVSFRGQIQDLFRLLQFQVIFRGIVFRLVVIDFGVQFDVWILIFFSQRLVRSFQLVQDGGFLSISFLVDQVSRGCCLRYWGWGKMFLGGGYVYRILDQFLLFCVDGFFRYFLLGFKRNLCDQDLFLGLQSQWC